MIYQVTKKEIDATVARLINNIYIALWISWNSSANTRATRLIWAILTKQFSRRRASLGGGGVS